MVNQTPSANLIRLLIADDHEMARGGLKSFFIGDRNFAVVGEAADGDSTLQLCESLQPHLALLDIRMGATDGLALAAIIRDRFPAVRVIMVTMHADTHYLVEAIRIGAAGYLLKDCTRSECLSTVRRVYRGETVFDQALMTRALQSLSTGGSTTTPVALTCREQEVLRLLTSGMTNRQIAGHLMISVGTAKVHVERIIGKLGVTDRTQAAVMAVQMGLVLPAP